MFEGTYWFFELGYYTLIPFLIVTIYLFIRFWGTYMGD